MKQESGGSRPSRSSPESEQQDMRASRSSKRQRVRQAEEQPTGASEAVGDHVRGSDGTIKQNKTKPVFCRNFLYKYNFAIPTKFYLVVSTMVI